MRKKFVILFLVAIFAISLFAFVACNEGDNVSRGWVVNIKTGINMTATVSFLAGETEDDLLWRAFVNTGGMEEGYDQGANNNNNWCNGHYYFDGEPGKSTLHMMLYDHDAYVEATGDTGTDITNTYDPSNARLLDENGKQVGFNTYIDIEPDEDGGYTFTFVLRQLTMFVGDKGNFTATIIPPQDGTLGSGGEAVYAPEPEGLTFIETVVAIVVPVAVVLIAGIVVTIILVRKNKKKKEAAAAESDPMRSYSDGSEDGGVQ